MSERDSNPSFPCALQPREGANTSDSRDQQVASASPSIEKWFKPTRVHWSQVCVDGMFVAHGGAVVRSETGPSPPLSGCAGTTCHTRRVCSPLSSLQWSCAVVCGVCLFRCCQCAVCTFRSNVACNRPFFVCSFRVVFLSNFMTSPRRTGPTTHSITIQLDR